jgi:hypothetical protein
MTPLASEIAVPLGASNFEYDEFLPYEIVTVQLGHHFSKIFIDFKKI